MTHLFICDGCGLQADPSTRTGAMPRGWTLDGEAGRHLCNRCAGARALARIAAEPGEPRAATYDLTRDVPELDAEQALARAETPRAQQKGFDFEEG